MQEQKKSQQSISTKTARNLATTTKTVPQMEAITPRWLLKALPWVQVESGTYRVNRKKIVMKGDEKIIISEKENRITVEGKNLRAISLLRDLDQSVLDHMAAHFVCEQCLTGDLIINEGEPGDKFFVIARGKVEVATKSPSGKKLLLAIIAEGGYFGEVALIEDTKRIATVKALSSCVLLSLERSKFETLLEESPELLEGFKRVIKERLEARTKIHESGESPIEMQSGYEGEVDLPETFVDYSDEPQEYPLSVIQTVIKVHTRVSDLYNEPIDQLREQLRMTMEGMKERQEWEMINNEDVGLLHVAASKMRVQTRTGPPTPDDMDELLSRVWKKPAFFLAHPKAIAAFGRECTRRGVPPPTMNMFGCPFLTWRGIPLVPCDKIAVETKFEGGQFVKRSHILLLRVGEKEQGVVGLHHAGLPGEQLPSLSVRLMGIDNRAIASYLVTLYFSVAVLTEDALAVLENVEVGYCHDYD